MPDAPQFSPDARDIAPGTLRLRSERSGSGDGRVYLVVVVATDSSNNVSRNCLTVVVPHSLSKADKDAVAQQAQAALAPCATTGAAPAGFYVVGDGPVGPKAVAPRIPKGGAEFKLRPSLRSSRRPPAQAPFQKISQWHATGLTLRQHESVKT